MGILSKGEGLKLPNPTPTLTAKRNLRERVNSKVIALIRRKAFEQAAKEARIAAHGTEGRWNAACQHIEQRLLALAKEQADDG